jgi:hypothetical protein
MRAAVAGIAIVAVIAIAAAFLWFSASDRGRPSLAAPPAIEETPGRASQPGRVIEAEGAAAASRLRPAPFPASLEQPATPRGSAQAQPPAQASVTEETQGTRLVGDVNDREGQPVVGARILLFGRGGPPAELAHTDTHGRFETPPLQGDGFTLLVRSARHYEKREHVRHVQPFEKERRVDMQLERAPVAHGKLVLADGSPAKVAEHAAKLADPHDPEAKPSVVATHYDPRTPGPRVEGQILEAADAYEVVLNDKGLRYVALLFKNKVLGLAPLGDSKAAAPDIVVDWSKAPKPVPRGTLEVAARSREDGTPLTSYRLRLAPAAARRGEAIATSFDVSSATGRRRVEGLEAGVYRITVSAFGFETTTITFEVKPDPDPNDAEVAVPAAWATVAGRVTDPSGKALDRARVLLLPKDLDVPAGHSPPPPATAFTNAEGAFRFEKLGFGSYTVLAESAGFAPASVRADARPSAENLAVMLPPGFAVEVIPEGRAGPFTLAITTSAGLRIFGAGAGDGALFDSKITVRLVRGRYDATIGGAGFGKVTKSFTVDNDMTLRVPLGAPAGAASR